MAVERERKSPDRYKRRLARRRKRYQTDPVFRERLQGLEKEYRSRRERGEVKDPVVAAKWRLTRLEHQIEETAEELRDRKITDLTPLFPAGKEKVIQVYLSPNGYLCLRPGIKAEFKIDVQSALELYGFETVSGSLRSLKQSLPLKK